MEPLDSLNRWTDRMRDRARMGTFFRFLAKRFLDDRLFEAAGALGQEIVQAHIDLGPLEHFARVPGEEGIGEKIVVRAADHLTCSYHAEVEVTRPRPDFAALSDVPFDQLPGDALRIAVPLLALLSGKTRSRYWGRGIILLGVFALIGRLRESALAHGAPKGVFAGLVNDFIRIQMDEAAAESARASPVGARPIIRPTPRISAICSGCASRKALNCCGGHEISSEQPARISGISTVLSGERIFEVSAMKCTPAWIISCSSTFAACCASFARAR